MRPPAPPRVIALALIVPLLSLITTWQGYHFQHPPERLFMGFRYMAGDHYQYAAFMREAHDGAGLFMPNPFASEPQKGVFVMPYFWLVGVLSRLTGGSVAPWWEILRVVGGAAYIITFWIVTGDFFQKDRQRFLATGAFCLAGGLDWIVTGLRSAGWTALKPLEHPFDYYWNWSTFGTLQVPHWIWPALLMLAAARAAIGTGRLRDLVVFASLPAIFFLHAYSGMVAYLAFGLLPLVPIAVAALGPEKLARGRVSQNVRAALPALLSFAVVAGYLAWARSDAVFRAGSERGLSWTSSFTPWWYPLSYGLLLPAAWYVLKSMARERSLKCDMVIAWLAAAVMLSANKVYAGVKFQYLVFPPLVLLAARGMIVLTETTRFGRSLSSSRARAALLGAVLCLNAPVSLVKDFPAAKDDRDIYMSSAEVEAMTWLGTQPDGVVISSYRNGNRIPWLSGKRVFIGHWFLTPDLDAKSQNVAALFSPQVPARYKEQILAASGARYLYLGAEDAAAGFDDVGLPLRKIYDAGGCRIYRIGAS